MEIERKFLLKEAVDTAGLDHYHISQAYICYEPVIRVRKITRRTEKGSRSTYVLTLKGKGLAAHEEIEWALPAKSYRTLLAKKEGRVIEKTRYLLPLEDGHTAELDIFEGDLAGLVMAEVEFPSEEDMHSFVPPAFFGQEVTDDPRYHNSCMSGEEFTL